MKPRTRRLEPRSAVLICLALAFAAGGAAGQPLTLQERRDAKLASEFINKADWVPRLDRAVVAAKRTERLIFGYFTRSYAP